MNIWVSSSEFPWQEAGGIGRYYQNFISALTDQNHQVTWFGLAKKNADYRTNKLTRIIEIAIPEQADLSDIPAPLTLPPAAFASLELVQHMHSHAQTNSLPDIIEFQEFRALPYYAIQTKLTGNPAWRQVPLLVHLHSPTFLLKKINQQARFRFPDYWTGQMEKFSIIAADAIISPSEFLAKQVTTKLGNNLPVTCIPYALGPMPSLQRQPASIKKIVYFGRLELRKGILPLVHACQSLWLAGYDFHLQLIGGDTSFAARNTTIRQYLERKYQSWIKRGNIEILGEKSHAETMRCVTDAWAVVIPSLWENFPNTCMEAMAARQLVLAAQNGGQAEMIGNDESNGFLFDWDQQGNFEQQLARVLTLSDDHRASIGNNAKHRIQQMCDPQLIVEKRIAHYQKTIDDYRPRRLFPTTNFITNKSTPPLVGQQKLLSIIVPFYNLGQYLLETIQNICQSSYQPFEILIVNDGSDDPASLKALQQIEHLTIPNLRIINTSNQGLALTRNAGVAAAQGEYVTFVDADDLVESDYFKRAIEVLERFENVAFVYSWVQFFENSTRIWPTWNTELPYLLGHNMLTAFAVVRRNWFEYAGKNKPVFEYALEDYDSWLSIVLAGGIGVSIPEPLVRYRVRTGSMSRLGNADERLYLYDRLVELHHEAFQQWGPELFQLLNANGPAHLWDHPMQENPDNASYQKLGVMPSDKSLQVAAKFIQQMRQNWIFKNVIRHPKIYPLLRTLLKKIN